MYFFDQNKPRIKFNVLGVRGSDRNSFNFSRVEFWVCAFFPADSLGALDEFTEWKYVEDALLFRTVFRLFVGEI